jgi:hypothetical protein
MHDFMPDNLVLDVGPDLPVPNVQLSRGILHNINQMIRHQNSRSSRNGMKQ